MDGSQNQDKMKSILSFLDQVEADISGDTVNLEKIMEQNKSARSALPTRMQGVSARNATSRASSGASAHLDSTGPFPVHEANASAAPAVSSQAAIVKGKMNRVSTGQTGRVSSQQGSLAVTMPSASVLEPESQQQQTAGTTSTSTLATSTTILSRGVQIPLLTTSSSSPAADSHVFQASSPTKTFSRAPTGPESSPTTTTTTSPATSGSIASAGPGGDIIISDNGTGHGAAAGGGGKNVFESFRNKVSQLKEQLAVKTAAVENMERLLDEMKQRQVSDAAKYSEMLKQQLLAQKNEFEDVIQRQLGFITKLLADKEVGVLYIAIIWHFASFQTLFTFKCLHLIIILVVFLTLSFARFAFL